MTALLHTRLRVAANAMKGIHADVAREAADEIERLLREAETKTQIINLLRCQLRVLGHIPCVTESNDIALAELAMRKAAN